MVKHIVMFRLKDIGGKTAAENAAMAKEMADKLPALIPSVRSMEVRLNSPLADSTNYHIALICEFDDMKGLDEYQNHPEHKKFGAFIAGLKDDGNRACIDFEI
ncbi:MAG: Dabb family protein [Oscillospiraceae bacterium]|nr:Dabb family protein [Oscillospiraceae bacterium]